MVYACNPTHLSDLEIASFADRILQRARIAKCNIVVVVLERGLMAVEDQPGAIGALADQLGTYSETSPRQWIEDDLRGLAETAEPPASLGRQPALNLTGELFGRLRVEGEAPRDASGNRMWRCRCACGKQVVAAQHHLRSQNVSSCGCARRAMLVTHKQREWRRRG